MFSLSLDPDTTIVSFYSHLQFFLVAQWHISVVVQTEVLQNLNKTYMKSSDKINEKANKCVKSTSSFLLSYLR